MILGLNQIRFYGWKVGLPQESFQATLSALAFICYLYGTTFISAKTCRITRKNYLRLTYKSYVYDKLFVQII